MSTDAQVINRRTSITILIILFSLNVLNLIDRTVINVAMEAIKHDLQLTDGQLGLLQSMFYVGVGVMTIPGGILLDRWGRKKTVALMAVMWSIATIGTGLAKGFGLISVTRLFCGAGEAGFGPGGGAWLSFLFPKKNLAMINSLFQMGAPLGGVIGMIAGGLIIAKTGDWRLPFLIFGGGGILLGIAVLFMPDVQLHTDTKEHTQSIMSGVKEIFAIPTFLRASCTIGCASGFAMALGAWSVPLLMRGYGIDAGKAGIIAGIAALAAVAGTLLGGVITDKIQQRLPYGRPLVGVCGNILMGVISAIMLISCGKVPLGLFIVFFCLFNLMSNGFQPACQVMNLEVTPCKLRGTGASIQTFMIFAVFSSWGAWVMGLLSDFFNRKAAAAAAAAGAAPEEVQALTHGVWGLQASGMCMLILLVIGAIAGYMAMKTYPIDLARAIDLENYETGEDQVCDD